MTRTPSDGFRAGNSCGKSGLGERFLRRLLQNQETTMTDDERAIAFYRELWVANGTQSEQHIIGRLAAEFAAVRKAVLARVDVCGRCYGNKTIASRNPLAGEGPDICPRCHGRGVVEGET